MYSNCLADVYVVYVFKIYTAYAFNLYVADVFSVFIAYAFNMYAIKCVFCGFECLFITLFQSKFCGKAIR